MIIYLYEVILKGKAILRLAAGESYDCADCKQPIIGDVWQSIYWPKRRCTACAIRADREALGPNAVRQDSSTHQWIGTQSAYPVAIDE